jgi:hypothetical protein
MTKALIPFETGGLPAHLAAAFQISDDLASGGGGFPVISIKGKIFTLKRGDEAKMITKPDAPDEPANAIEVVILKAYPGKGKTAKAWYTTGYVEGSDANPACYSNDGDVPAADSEEPQATNCATCPQAQWGSKISEDGKKVKACADVKRLAIAPLNQLNDPMLLRVPAASLKALTEYSGTLAKRNVPYQAVVTKIGFDYTVAYPALTFRPVGFISEDDAVAVASEMNSDIVKRITGEIESPRKEKAEKPAAAKAAEKPAEKPKAAKAAEKPAEKPAEVAKEEPKVSTVEAGSGLASALDGIDFDDE